MVLTVGTLESWVITVVFFELMVYPNSLKIGRRVSVGGLQSEIRGLRHRQTSSRMRIRQTFVWARSRAMLKSLPSVLVLRKTPSSQLLNAYWRSSEKKIPNSVGASTHPCLTPLLTGNASDVVPLKLTMLCVSSWKEAMIITYLNY